MNLLNPPTVKRVNRNGAAPRAEDELPKLSPLSALEPVGGEEGEVHKINLFIAVAGGAKEGLPINAEPVNVKRYLFFVTIRRPASFGPL